MATTFKHLCRLCAKKNEFCKDLKDENNKNVLDLVRTFTQINVNASDNLPTKVCLDCEEKLVSFQIFILECDKVQDLLRNMIPEQHQIKLESDVCNFGAPVIKSEVKLELTAEDIVNAINDEVPTYEDDNFHANDDNDGYDDLDNVTIASLKTLKYKLKRKEKLSVELNDVLKRPNLKTKDFVMLECNICESPFNSWSGLDFHYYKAHKSKPVAFCICGFTIRSRNGLYKHVTDHKQESRKMRNYLDPHTNQSTDKHGIKDYINFICFSCEKVCSSWYTLKSHCERIHRIPPMVRCFCGITMKSKSVMYKHVQDHRNPNELSCDQCSLITKSADALMKHKMKHIPKSERQYRCNACNKIFSNKDALKSHEKSHIPIEDRKVYHCDMCDLKFTTRSSAASHRRVVHERIKSYVCDLCGYACGTNGELRQHRAIHSDDKPFVCKTCSKSFKTYSNLKTHMDTHEQTSYTCYVCSRVLNSRRTLRKHLLVHEDKCLHVCSYCNKAFKRRQTLKVHTYTHTGDKPLSCKWCEERFSYASTLRSHRLRCHPDKMATQAHSSYPTYSHVVNAQENYVKNDLAAVGVTKNEVESM